MHISSCRKAAKNYVYSCGDEVCILHLQIPFNKQAFSLECHIQTSFSTLSLFSSLKKLFVALTVVFMDNVWAILVSALLDGKAPDVR